LMAMVLLARSFLLCLPLLTQAKRISVKLHSQEEALIADNDFESDPLPTPGPSDFESDAQVVALSFMESDMKAVGDYSNFAGASAHAKKFVKPFEALAFGSKDNRVQEWRRADYNGNGYMSLAELDAYIEKKLKLEYPKKDAGLLLWKAFRPSYIRAFMDAKDVLDDKAIKGTRSTTDDYISFGEFRVALHYVCLYALMYDRFAEIDGFGYGGEVGEFKGGVPPALRPDEYDDRRIDKKEWLAGYGSLANSGFVGLQDISDPEAVFAEIDANGGGFILLKEWCEWLEKKEAEAGTEFGRILTLGEE